MATEPRSRTARKRILLALGAVTSALLAGEVACRVRMHRINEGTLEVAIAEGSPSRRRGRTGLIDIIQVSPNSRIVFELKPGLEAVEFKGAPVTTNRFGFRGKPLEPEEGPDTVTIVGLGDSIMFGWGVGDGQEYLSILERMLIEKYPDKDWRVVNLAVPAYNTAMEVEAFASKALQFGPDLVILSLVPNDLALPEYLRVVQDVFDLRRSFLAELIAERAASRGDDEEGEGRHPLLVHATPDDHGRGTPEQHRDIVGWQPFLREVRRLAELSREHGFEVVSLTTVENDTTDEMYRATAALGFRHVRLMPEIQAWLSQHDLPPFSFANPEAYMRSGLVYAPGDGHPSALQHEMIAKKLLVALEDSGFILRRLR